MQEVNRRQFLQRSALAATIGSNVAFSYRALKADGAGVSANQFEVVDIQRTTAKLEFRPTPRRNMDREIPHWRYIEVCDVTLKSGIRGTGETMLFYTWGVPSEEAVQKTIGANAVEMMWDDSLGAGLQMALFDAVGKTAGVPAHALLGNKIYETTPLSWWNIDTSAKDMASECKLAYETGYMSYKTKGRPWFDIDEQLKLASQAVPAEFKIDMDFNDTLLTAEQGLPILKRLAKYPQVDIYETPIPQSDIPGNKKIAEEISVNIAMHYGNPRPADVVRSKCCDGFVVGKGANRLTSSAKFCEQVEMPFWLQLVGAGMTAAFSLHFGAVHEQARWPAVNCHQLFEHDLLTRPIIVKDGHAEVPDAPGIGYDIDRDLLEKFKVPRPAERPEPVRLIETTWSDGKRMLTANNGNVNFMIAAANAGKIPFYAPGAHTRLLKDDGSARFKELYNRARKEGPIEVSQ